MNDQPTPTLTESSDQDVSAAVPTDPQQEANDKATADRLDREQEQRQQDEADALARTREQEAARADAAQVIVEREAAVAEADAAVHAADLDYPYNGRPEVDDEAGEVEPVNEAAYASGRPMAVDEAWAKAQQDADDEAADEAAQEAAQAPQGVTVGRVVRYLPASDESAQDGGYAAIVTRVWTDPDRVNLAVFLPDGSTAPATSIAHHDDEPDTADRPSWAWPTR